MPCFHPIQAFRRKSGQKPDGSWPLVFNITDGDLNNPVTIPCGSCEGCRLEQARQWTARLINEKQMHEKSCFITLTYKVDPQTLNKDDFPLFMKRLRKKYGNDIRFFQCGEYGEQFRRPHHHALIFNHDFPDKYHWRTISGTNLYRSKSLETLWPYGYCTIGACTPESIAYTARYVVKKQSGAQARFNYSGHLPEYITMSRRPGIGKQWFDKYKNDVTAIDKVIISERLTLRTPRYYDYLYHKENPSHMERIKKQRLSKVNPADNTPARLKIKQQYQQLTLQKLKRNYECPHLNSSQSVIPKFLLTSAPLSNLTKSLLSGA